MSKSKIKHIISNGERIAFIIRESYRCEGKHFFGMKEDILQVGYMDLKKKEKITPHHHNKVRRSIRGTPEVIHILSGRLKVVLYDRYKRKISSHILKKGDTLVLLSGGHGFKALDKCRFFEVKQGYFVGVFDKEKFNEK